MSNLKKKIKLFVKFLIAEEFSAWMLDGLQQQQSLTILFSVLIKSCPLFLFSSYLSPFVEIWVYRESLYTADFTPEPNICYFRQFFLSITNSTVLSSQPMVSAVGFCLLLVHIFSLFNSFYPIYVNSSSKSVCWRGFAIYL